MGIAVGRPRPLLALAEQAVEYGLELDRGARGDRRGLASLGRLTDGVFVVTHVEILARG